MTVLQAARQQSLLFASVWGEDLMPSRRLSPLGFQFFLLGTFAWIAAALFVLLDPTVVVNSNPQVGGTPIYAPNVAAAGAAIGFGIGGGLCFLGAAILYGKERGKAVTPAESAESAAAPDRGAITTSRASTPNAALQ